MFPFLLFCVCFKFFCVYIFNKYSFKLVVTLKVILYDAGIKILINPKSI